MRVLATVAWVTKLQTDSAAADQAGPPQNTPTTDRGALVAASTNDRVGLCEQLITEQYVLADIDPRTPPT